LCWFDTSSEQSDIGGPTSIFCTASHLVVIHLLRSWRTFAENNFLKITKKNETESVTSFKHDLINAETLLRDNVDIASSNSDIPAATREVCQNNLTKFIDANTPHEIVSDATASAK
jgi:hypothetical protein